MYVLFLLKKYSHYLGLCTLITISLTKLVKLFGIYFVRQSNFAEKSHPDYSKNLRRNIANERASRMTITTTIRNTKEYRIVKMHI